MCKHEEGIVHRGFTHYRQFKANTHDDLLFLRLLHPTHGYNECGSHTLSRTDDRQTDKGKHIHPLVEGDMIAETSGLGACNRKVTDCQNVPITSCFCVFSLSNHR